MHSSPDIYESILRNDLDGDPPFDLLEKRSSLLNLSQRLRNKGCLAEGLVERAKLSHNQLR